jgi:hypothetical protein
MTRDTAAIAGYLRSIAANTFRNDDGTITEFQYEPHRQMILDAANRLESLQSIIAWREQLLCDATRYFDFGDDDAVAYYKALDRQGLTFNFGEKVNPRHKKEPEVPLADIAMEEERMV